MAKYWDIGLKFSMVVEDVKLFNPAVAGVFRHPRLVGGGGELNAPTS